MNLCHYVRNAISKPSIGDTVKVHYIGMFEDGTEFDNSYNRHAALFFRVGDGQVIEGWEKAILKVCYI